MSEFGETGMVKRTEEAMEEFLKKSTTATNAEPGNDISGIVTVTVIVIGILITIIGLFGMAIFIDCRHQTLDESGEPKRTLRLRIPNFLRRNIDNDTDSIANRMENENAATIPPAILVS